MKKLVIIDINNFIYRAYFGIQQRLTAPDGTPVNAVHGTFSMIHRLLLDSKPSHVVVAKDSKHSLRKEIYPQYKENRSRMPEDLQKQIPLIYQMLDFMNLDKMEYLGYEADDIINSLVQKYQTEFDEILIASGDKDLMQLVNSKVKCVDTMKNKTYGALDVKAKLGISPHQVLDYLALLGDSSDNIPGVQGVGEKTAVKLIDQFDSLTNIYNNLPALSEKLRKKLEEQKAQALLSQELARLKLVELNQLLSPFSGDYKKKELVEFLAKLAMKTSITKVEEMGTLSS